MGKRSDLTYWNIPVTKCLDEALEKAVRVNAHMSKSDFSQLVKEAITETTKEAESNLKEVEKADEEAPKCPKCDEELTHVKKIDGGRFLKVDLPDGYEPYICDNCRILYKVKNTEDSEKTDNCPYCDEELQKIRGNLGLFHCSSCHKVFRPD